MVIWVSARSNQEVPIVKQYIKKKKEDVIGKTPFFKKVHFVLLILFFLKLASDVEILHGNVEF